MSKKELIQTALTRSVAEVIQPASLTKKLNGSKKLRVKLGIDPTSPNIHLGRAVALLKLRDFQNLGHKAIFIVGDFTGVIGDTSDKDSERPMLTPKEIKANLKTYLEQAGKIIDLRKAEVHYNSQWLSKLKYAEIGEQADAFSIADFIARDNIKKRLNEGKRVSLREVLYPLMQAYDSVAIKADIELGGTDQKFNLLAGRTLQEKFKQAPQDVVMNELILGTDGRKMSSSWGNTINLTDSPEDMFGKVMRIPDFLITPYFLHCTRLPMKEIDKHQKALGSGNPRDVKMELAYQITRMYWGDKKAKAAQTGFVQVFQQRETPTTIATFKGAGMTLADSLVASKLVTSKSEARRLVEQKGIKIDGKPATDLSIKLKKGAVLQKGQRAFIKII